MLERAAANRDPPGAFSLDDPKDFGTIFERLYELCEVQPCGPTDQKHGAHRSQQDALQAVITEEPEVAEAFLQYIHAKCNQSDGLEGLRSACRAAWRPQLLHALAHAASVLFHQVTLGACEQLAKQQLQPRPMPCEAAYSPCTLQTNSGSSRSMSLGSSSSQFPADACRADSAPSPSPSGPPDWLHPLLHQLRPDQVMVLVSQLLLYLADLLDPR